MSEELRPNVRFTVNGKPQSVTAHPLRRLLDVLREDLQVQETQVITIEGLAQNEKARVLQEAFVECGGAQCGICTPGMVVASWTLLERNPLPTDQDLRNVLAGNLCRCTGYTRIFEAIKTASGRLAQAVAK